MKKIAVFLIASVLALSLCACGSSDAQNADPEEFGEEAEEYYEDDLFSMDEDPVDPEVAKQNFEKASAFIGSVIDTSKMTAETDDEYAEALYCYWDYEEETEGVPLSNEITVDGKTIVVGETTEKELEEMGFEVEKYSDVVGPEEAVSVTLVKGDKQLVLFLETNETDQEIPIGDIPVYGFTTGLEEYMIPFDYNGLKAGATIEEALEIFGEPNAGIVLTADESASIELSYYNETEVGDDLIMADELTLYFDYDAESNDAVLYSSEFSRDYYSEDWE